MDGGSNVSRITVRDAQGTGFRYFVLLADQEIIGFACLVIRRPEYWSDANDTQHLPQLVDLQVKESQRGHGYGSDLVRTMECVASEADYRELYMSVEPLNNPRAYALYQRLGYRQVQPEPYRKTWEFQDSEGQMHRGEEWIVDMMKQLYI